MTELREISFTPEHINYPLVEGIRPPIYTAMKYWGKKPHNIWRKYIESYCRKGGTVLDPFAGSAMSAFETVQAGRKSLCFDLNPITSFIIEVITADFNEEAFKKEFLKIKQIIQSDPIYKKHYIRTYNGEDSTVYNYRWKAGDVDEVCLETRSGKRYRIAAESIDKINKKQMENIKLPYWYPKDKFPKMPSVTHKFIKDIGGNGFNFLWTKRNLYLLSLLFNEILKIKDKNIQYQLLFGFIQTLHLTFKMVVPRSTSSNRDFSGSWGRADYMVRSKSLEQNPLIVFERSCLGKQSVLSSMKDAKKKLKEKTTISCINEKKKIDNKKDLNYGILDVADLTRYVEEKSVDFIITDPPYAGLVYYLDLSLVWLVWLQKVDKKYFPCLDAEITIKNEGETQREQYRRRLANAFKQIHKVLRDDGYLVITFHHKKIQEWNDFVKAVKIAGFRFDKVTHQYNRRSGESNVSNPYGTSGADFYIRCVKYREVDFTDDQSGLEHFVVQKTVEIIALRNEPTPYSFIVAGLIPEMIQAGYIHPRDYNQEIERVLKKQSGEKGTFIVKPNNSNAAGDIWWFREPEKHINYPDRPLQDRVEELVLSILRRKISVQLDEVIGELFQTYSNGLTPDPRNITTVLEKYATRTGGFWKIKEIVARIVRTHSYMISLICKIGEKNQYLTFVGKREQPDIYELGKTLYELSDIRDLSCLKNNYESQKIERIEMIDSLWLSPDRKSIEGVFEVENTTGFTSAIQRASNIESDIPKFMIIPINREQELKRIKDPLFIKSFRDNNWKYLTYDDVERLSNFSKPTITEILKLAKEL